MSILLVTGGAGFIGSHLVDSLVELGHNVIVIDDFSSGKEENLFNSIDKIILYRKNVCENLDDIFDKHSIDIIFHVAAVPRVQFSIKHPDVTHNANVNGTFNLLNACRKFGVKRFIFSSSSSVYGTQDKLPLDEEMIPNPMSPYALHKLIGEQYCTLFNTIYGIKTISLRYFNVYGKRQDPSNAYANLIPKFTSMFSRNEIPTINGDGNQTRDFTHVSDIVKANICAMNTINNDAFGKAFNIGSGKSFSVNDIVAKLNRLIGSNIKPIHGPSVIEPRATLADIKKAKIFLGWEPKMNFDNGLKDSIS